MDDLSRLCVHTITTDPWSLAEAVQAYEQAGVRGITVWRKHLEVPGLQQAEHMLRDSGMAVVSLCRGGFFPGRTVSERQANLDDNRRAIEEARAIGAPLIVLVCGAVPGIPLAEARQQIAEGIAAVLPDAQAAGVKLAIEPLHPMYAGDRSAINTLRQANDMVEALGSAWLGVTVDVYHVWWDPELEAEVRRAAKSILSFHVCDWKLPVEDLLLDRGLMGEGCIDIRGIRSWVEQASFDGFVEVEIFSRRYWQMDQHQFLQMITRAYLDHV